MTFEPGSRNTSAPRYRLSSTLSFWPKAKPVISQLLASVCRLRLSIGLADPVGADSGNPLVPFGEHWLGAFRETKAFAIWDSVTDPVLFDLCEPRSVLI